MTKTLLIAAIGFALLLGSASTLPAQESPPDPLLQRAARIEERARQMKAEGRPDEAARLMRTVEELRARRERAGRPEGPGPDQRRLDRMQVERELDQLRAKLGDVAAGGNETAVAEIERRMAALERRRDALQRESGAESARMRDRERPEGRGPGRSETEQRRPHVREAIEHLHAAGMHDMADTVERRMAERWAQGRLEPGVAAGPAGREGQGGGPVDRRFEEVYQGLRTLNERLERLERRDREGR